MVEFEVNQDTIEQSAIPVEIQLWTKIENKKRCMKDLEELVGSVFVDVRSLIGTRRNYRLRNEAIEIVNSHDGYYTVF